MQPAPQSVCRLSLASLAVSLVLFTGAATPAALLFYGGDYNVPANWTNGQTTDWPDAYAFDDFTVTDPGGWVVSSFFSNNLMNFTGVQSAYYQVRQGISSGNGGTLISDGIVPATQTLTGRLGPSPSGVPEYTVEGIIPGGLSLAPGTYFLSIVPIGFGNGNGVTFSYITGTDGLAGSNAVGSPVGDGIGFYDRPSFLRYRDAFVESPAQGFSLGVNGTAGGGAGGGGGGGGSDAGVGAPEPGTVALGLSALALAAGHWLWQWRRKRA